MVDAEVERRGEHRMRLRLARLAVDAGEGHRPHADRRDLRAIPPELPLLHPRPPCTISPIVAAPTKP